MLSPDAPHRGRAPFARHLAATRTIVFLLLFFLRADLEAAEATRLVAITATAEATAATAGSRAEASGPWWTRRAILAGARFADGEGPALERLCVKLADDFLCLRTVDKLDERKSARATGLAIDRHGNVGGLCDGR